MEGIIKKLAILGYGGHSKVVCEIAEQKNFEILIFDDNLNNKQACAGIINEFYEDGPEYFHVAIGDNEKRKRIFCEALLNNKKPVTLIHASSVISNKAKLHDGIFVGPKAVINADAEIGKGTIINSASLVEHDCKIGDFSHICPMSALAGNVKVGDMAFIGIGSCVKNDILIGNQVTVGAGSVIVKNLDDNNLYFGNPARKNEE